MKNKYNELRLWARVKHDKNSRVALKKKLKQQALACFVIICTCIIMDCVTAYLGATFFVGIPSIIGLAYTAFQFLRLKKIEKNNHLTI